MATPFRDLIKNDYLIVDDPEAITYTSINDVEGSDPYIFPVTHAFRDDLTGAEVNPSQGVYTRNDQVWFIPVAETETLGFRPKLGDHFNDPDNTYQGTDTRLTILEVGRNPERQYWRLVVRNLALHFQLRTLVTHLRPENKPDGSAGRIPSFTTVNAAVPARIQERARAADTIHGRRAVRINYAIWVAFKLSVQAQDVIRDAAGNDYTVLNAVDPDRIDVLQEIECERIV